MSYSPVSHDIANMEKHRDAWLKLLRKRNLSDEMRVELQRGVDILQAGIDAMRQAESSIPEAPGA